MPPREANAALLRIVRRDSGESYEEFRTTLAKASGTHPVDIREFMILSSGDPPRG
jgi:hypothetical protein